LRDQFGADHLPIGALQQAAFRFKGKENVSDEPYRAGKEDGEKWYGEQ
jgi:hypothetical protein